MKVAQEIDVDNVTIIINPQNKLQAVGSSLEFEEIAVKKDEMNPTLFSPFELEGSHRYHERKINLTKLFKLKGTDFYLFGGELEEIVRPQPPEPTIRTSDINNHIYFSNRAEGLAYEDIIEESLENLKHLFPTNGFKFEIVSNVDSLKKVFHIRLINEEFKLFDITNSEDGIEVVDKVELFPLDVKNSWKLSDGSGSIETAVRVDSVYFNVTNVSGLYFRIEDINGNTGLEGHSYDRAPKDKSIDLVGSYINSEYISNILVREFKG